MGPPRALHRKRVAIRCSWWACSGLAGMMQITGRAVLHKCFTHRTAPLPDINALHCTHARLRPSPPPAASVASAFRLRFGALASSSSAPVAPPCPPELPADAVIPSSLAGPALLGLPAFRLARAAVAKGSPAASSSAAAAACSAAVLVACLAAAGLQLSMPGMCAWSGLPRC
jgi:hypothetical protein